MPSLPAEISTPLHRSPHVCPLNLPQVLLVVVNHNLIQLELLLLGPLRLLQIRIDVNVPLPSKRATQKQKYKENTKNGGETKVDHVNYAALSGVFQPYHL